MVNTAQYCAPCSIQEGPEVYSPTIWQDA